MADERDSDGEKPAEGDKNVNPLIAQIVRSIKVNLDGYAPDKVRVTDAAPPPDYATQPTQPQIVEQPDPGSPDAPMADAAKTVGRDLSESLQRVLSTSQASERAATSQDISGLGDSDVTIASSDGRGAAGGAVGGD